MKFFTQYLTLIITLFFGYSNSIPTFPEERASVEKRALSVPIFSKLNSLSPSATGDGDYAIALSELQFAIPTASPTSPQQALSSLSSIYEASPTPQNLYAAMAEYIEAGITSDNTASVLQYISGALDGENSDTNVNPRDPDVAIYPKASPNDAPYDLTEEQLREAIYIPSTFRYGDGLQPIILVPGTGSTGYFTFAGNYIPLLQGSSIGDPVWLNIPGYLLNDAQTNAEYVAYAINYIYGISNNREVAVFGWSQGNIDTQWAFKYWPSTRNRTTDFVAFSPDYHGTILANFIALGEPLPPSVLQQEYNRYITDRSDTFHQQADNCVQVTSSTHSGIMAAIALMFQPPMCTQAFTTKLWSPSKARRRPRIYRMHEVLAYLIMKFNLSALASLQVPSTRMKAYFTMPWDTR